MTLPPGHGHLLAVHEETGTTEAGFGGVPTPQAGSGRKIADRACDDVPVPLLTLRSWNERSPWNPSSGREFAPGSNVFPTPESVCLARTLPLGTCFAHS